MKRGRWRQGGVAGPATPALWALSGALVLGACSGGVTEGSAVRSVEVLPSVSLAVGVGDTVRFLAIPRDQDGSPVFGAEVAWATDDPAVATADARGLVTARGAGATSVWASSGGVDGHAGLEVWVPEEVTEHVPGRSYFGRRSYVEYVPGELPVVVSAPHGGDLTPGEIPDRTWGTLVTDRHTRETLAAVRDAFVALTGQAPHVVVSHLERTKLDPNREVEEAAQGSPFARQAWEEFHRFIELAEHRVAEDHGRGLYFDLHGHGHRIQRIELGYLLTAADLNRPDAELDGLAFVQKSSIRARALAVGGPFSALVRGDASFGAALEAEGLPVVPAPSDPAPGQAPYFSGGYDTWRHGSREAGRVVSGIQVELHLSGIRDTEANRRAFAAKFARAVQRYLSEHMDP